MKSLLRCAVLMALLGAQAGFAKTWALLVGISRYQRLSPDLWLQYADSDAESFARFFASPQGGSVPNSQVRVLTNSGATAAAIREAFDGFLKSGPGRDDSVFIVIAGHATVDAHGAYILTFDSDPADLSATAVGMGELRGLVERELQVAGRVVLFADVCRAAAIGERESAGAGSAVEKLGEVSGDLLGLMAARPKELSNEGPEYGGGHGAFTDSVLRALNGAADVDKSGAVTAGELIDFVSTDVPKATGGRQHPRDFGNMENATVVAGAAR